MKDESDRDPLIHDSPFGESWSFRARWILPLDSSPIENGVVEIVDGCVAALHGRHDPRAIDLGNVAIIPALVNAHTHLEFSDLATPLGPAERFADWVQAVVGHRRNRIASGTELVRRGVHECAQAGTTAVAEITTDEQSLDAFDDFGPTVFALREMIGLLPEQVDSRLGAAKRFLDAPTAGASKRVRRGLSPHAPYSVHPQLLRRLIELAAERHVLVAMHLAETKEELELLNRGSGPFADMLKRFGVWSSTAFEPGSRPIDFLRQLDNVDRALIIHGNYLSDEELDFVAARPHLTVVYCPRTHAYFGHRPHCWLQLLDRGASVAIGTDSRASNPDLSVRRELCFLREHFPRVAPKALLRLGTANGARALGLSADNWSLAIGGEANLAVVDLNAVADRDPYDAIFDPRCRIVRTMHQGQWFA
jgi:cytosine/adenosine deaminase-related metal-dependent hydrolase